jgi:preprotein translocase subunit SecE
MTEEIKTQGIGPADKAKLSAAVAIAVAGVVAYYLLANQAAWMRWLAVAAGLVLAALVVNFSRYGAEFRRFMELSRIELRKIVWPTRDETIKMTIAVFIFVAVAGVFFWGVDLVLAWATKFLTTPGS